MSKQLMDKWPRLAKGGDRLSSALGWFIGLVFIIAAMMKAQSPDDMLAVLPALTGQAVSPESGFAVLAALVVLEIVLGALLISGWRPRLVGAAAAAVLIVFSLALLRLAANPAAPSCGCFGAIRLRASAQTANMYGLVRNAGLLVGCALLIFPAAARVSFPPDESAPDDSTLSAHSHCTGLRGDSA